jgi:hypothetical protein
MQGTIVMLMALSGLGCHNKCYDVVYAPPSYGCFGGGCYANVYPTGWASPQSYNGCYAGGYSGCYSAAYGCFGGGCFGGCYSSCYSACYGGGYGGHHGCGLLARLFSCCRWKNSSYYAFDTYDDGLGSGMGYQPPIFGYALQYNYGPGTADAVGPAASSSPSVTPSEAAPVQPNPVPTTPMPSQTAPPPPSATTPPPPSAVSPAAPPPPVDVTPVKPKT